MSSLFREMLSSAVSPWGDFIAPASLSPFFLMISKLVRLPCGDSIVMSQVPATLAACPRGESARQDTAAIITIKDVPRILFIWGSPYLTKQNVEAAIQTLCICRAAVFGTGSFFRSRESAPREFDRREYKQASA